MPVKLIAFDLDGTAITNHRDLPPENRAAFEQAAARGIHLVPASGRMKNFLPADIVSLPGVRYIITANGAGVYDAQTGEAVWRCLIPNEKALQVQALLEEYDLFVEYYKEGKAITRKGDPERAFTHFGFPESKGMFLKKDYLFAEDLPEMLRQTGLTPEKINLSYLPTPQLRQEVRSRLEALGGLKLTSSIPDNLEINAEGAHKGAALKVLADKLGIPQEDVMALGDNGNDVTMLEYAGVSVCMEDGSPEAKAAAKYLVGPHDQGGLAEAVHRFVLDC